MVYNINNNNKSVILLWGQLKMNGQSPSVWNSG